MVQTFEPHTTTRPTTVPTLAERPDDTWRAAIDAVPMMSLAADGRPRWIRKLGLSNLSLLPLLKLVTGRRRAGQPSVENVRLTSAPRAGLRGPNAVDGLRGPNAVDGLRGPNAVDGYRAPSYPSGASLRPRASTVAAAVVVALLLALGATQVPDAIGELPYEAAISERPTADPGPPLPPSPGGGGGSTGTNGGGGQGDPSVNPGRDPGVTTNDDVVVTKPPPPTTSTPSTTVPPVVDRPVTPEQSGGPLVQVSAAAQAGVDGRLAVGLGDGACIGLQVSTLVVGCTPEGRDRFGVTADVSGSLLPPIHLSIP